MTEPRDQKEFIDPATATAVAGFTIRSIAQAIIGWVGLEFFKKYLNKFKNWRNKNENSNESVFGEKPPE